MGIVHSISDNSDSDPPPRREKPVGRPTIKKKGQSKRMVVEAPDSPKDLSDSGDTRYRSFRDFPEQEMPSIPIMDAGSSVPRGRRISDQLELSPGLCFSTSKANTQSTTKTCIRTIHSDSDSSTMAQEDVVSTNPEITDRGATGASHNGRPPQSGNGNEQTNSPSPTDTAISGMESQRRSLQSEGLPAEAIETVLAARSSNTQSTYDASWKCFVGWCCARGIYL